MTKIQYHFMSPKSFHVYFYNIFIETIRIFHLISLFIHYFTYNCYGML